MNEPVISLRNVHKSYCTGEGVSNVINNFSLDIFHGEIIAFTGRSGSGKTTILNIIGCLDDVTSGKYFVKGVDVSKLTEDEKSVLRGRFFGFIFQKYNLLKDSTVLDNICLPATYVGVQTNVRESKALDLLSALGLRAKQGAYPAQLSGGQQQRVSIARALINDAEIILADEPTGALDQQSGKEVINELKRLNKLGKTIILITHDMTIARIAHRIVEIDYGQIVNINSNSECFPGKKNAIIFERSFSEKKIDTLFFFKNALFLAWKSINCNFSKTLLTMLGIIIGITSVVLVTAIGDGAKNKVMQDINSFGNYSLNVYPGKNWDDHSPGGASSLKVEDFNKISKLNYINWFSPVLYSTNSIKNSGKEVKATVIGVANDYFKMQAVNLTQGHFFSQKDVDNLSQKVVIDENLAKILFYKSSPLGKDILIGAVPCTVVGVVNLSSTMLMQSGGPTVWIPFSSLMYRFDTKKYFDNYKIQLKNFNSSLDKKNLEEFLEKNHGEKDFFIIDNSESRDIIDRVYFTLSLMISSIALISLIVGGIGVMNMMIVAVSERKKEISIMMALGARQKDIFCQFLLEALIITFSGCIIGISLAVIICEIANLSQNQIIMSVSIFSMLISAIVSFVVGIVFGLYPAKRAAKLNPVIHLSYE